MVFVNLVPCLLAALSGGSTKSTWSLWVTRSSQELKNKGAGVSCASDQVTNGCEDDSDLPGLWVPVSRSIH